MSKQTQNAGATLVAETPINNIKLPRVLSDSALEQRVPMAFAEGAHPDVSDKYSFVRTADILPSLRSAGFVPTSARTRKSNKEFGMHTIEMFHEEALASLQINGETPRIVLVNSYDRTSSLRIMAGYYRLVCSNGMVLPSGPTSEFRVRHVGLNGSQIKRTIEDLARVLGSAAMLVDKMKERKLSKVEQATLANYAREARWNGWESQVPVEARQLLGVRRDADEGDDLWTVFSRIQENVIRGGLRTITGRKSRGVTSFTMETVVNRRLWAGAEAMLNGGTSAIQKLRKNFSIE